MEQDRAAEQQPRVTTMEDRAHKAQVEPYRSSPVVEVPDGVIACSFCGNTRFRRSRVRVQDLVEVLLLRYPVRCTRCNQRQYASYLTASLALPPRSHQERVARGGETWQAWTEQGRQGSRPMSTAVGPKATKIQAPMEPRRTQRDALPVEVNDEDSLTR